MTDQQTPNVASGATARQKADALWDIGAVATYLDVSPTTVRRHVRERDLPCRRVGRFLRFLPAEVEQWVSQQEAA